MEAFERNMDIVLEFAGRVDLYGLQEVVAAALRSHRMDEALAGCRRALVLCHRDCASRGTAEKEILNAPSYRRLVQLEEMIVDLESSLRSHQNGAAQPKPHDTQTRRRSAGQ